MATAINYQGLKKRETYDQVVDNLRNRQERVRFPNRLAKQIRNSPQLSNLLDGDGMGLVEMEKHQLNRMKEEQKEHAVRQAASQEGGTAQVYRALGPNENTEFYDIVTDNQSQVDDFQDAISNVAAGIEDRQEQKLIDVSAENSKQLETAMEVDPIHQAVKKHQAIHLWFQAIHQRK